MLMHMQDGFGVRYARANFVIFLLANFKYLLMRELINRMIFYNKIKSVMPIAVSVRCGCCSITLFDAAQEK